MAAKSFGGESRNERKRRSFSPRNCALEFVARLAGFEPTTLWFVARYSIQLSYSRKSAEPVYYTHFLELARFEV